MWYPVMPLGTLLLQRTEVRAKTPALSSAASRETQRTPFQPPLGKRMIHRSENEGFQLQRPSLHEEICTPTGSASCTPACTWCLVDSRTWEPSGSSASVDSSVIPLPLPGSIDRVVLWFVAHAGQSMVLATMSICGSLVGGYTTWDVERRGREAARRSDSPRPHSRADSRFW